jgi:alkylhydroperoxidase family enzyme
LEQAAIEFAERMTRHDTDVDDATFAALRASFSDEQLVELAAWVGLQSLYSMFNRALRIA